MVTFSSTSLFVGYGNGGALDGSGGAKSNVVEYDFKVNIINSFTIVGSNDGLRFHLSNSRLWALQETDGDANLVILNPKTSPQTISQLGTAPHGGATMISPSATMLFT